MHESISLLVAVTQNETVARGVGKSFRSTQRPAQNHSSIFPSRNGCIFIFMTLNKIG